MPNWCEIGITVQGRDRGEIDRFIKAVAGPEEPFDFLVIKPIPELVQNLRKGKRTFNVDGEIVSCSVWFSRGDQDGKIVEERPLSTDEQSELNALGVTDYMDWIYKNWGCKWNASFGDVHRCSDTEVAYQFETPWEPPTPLLDGLRKRFPRLKIVGKFDSPNDCWKGKF